MRTAVLILVLGPVTGWLAGRFIRYTAEGRWVMAAVCALGVADFWLGGPALLAFLWSVAHSAHAAQP